MAKKTEAKTEKIEKEYIIPLRSEWRKVPRYKRAAKAVKAIKIFLVQHMKVRDRDLDKIKIDKYLNEEVWHRGIRRPPSKIKVKAVKEGEIVRVELLEMPEVLKFKKAREEKSEKKAEEGKKKTKEKKEEHKHEAHEQTQKEKEEEEKIDEKEKEKAVIEAGKEIEKMAAKKIKHEKIAKSGAPKHQRNKSFPGK